MSVYRFNGNVYQSTEELLDAMKMDGSLVEEDDWQIQRHKSFKEYDAAEFLRMAEKYRNESPPDLIQCSEKMWLSVVYTIKLFYLNLGVHLASHRSLSFFYDLAVDKTSIGKQAARRLDKAFHTAEKLHSFAYGTPSFSMSQFPGIYAEIKYFVEEFPKIDASQLLSEINTLVSNGNGKDIAFSPYSELVKPKIGKQQFKPKFEFF